MYAQPEIYQPFGAVVRRECSPCADAPESAECDPSPHAQPGQDVTDELVLS